MNDDKLTEQVIGLAMKVHRVLGAGFVEFVYRNALLVELKRAGLSVEVERPIKVRYDGVIIGEFSVDLLIEGWLIVELKAVRALTEEHEVQTVNYLTAMEQDFGLLLNFGARAFSSNASSAAPKTTSRRTCWHERNESRQDYQDLQDGQDYAGGFPHVIPCRAHYSRSASFTHQRNPLILKILSILSKK